MLAQQTQYITVSTCWISAGPTSKMLVQPLNFWDLPDRCLFNIRTPSYTTILKVYKTQKRQYVLTCKARTYCHIIFARAESCDKRAYPANTIHCRRWRANITQHRVNVSCLLGIYCSPPLLTVAHSHAMGAGGRSNDGTASLSCVRFYTHNP